MCKGVRLTSSGCHVTSSHHRWGYPSCAHFNAQVPGRSTELLQIGVTDFHDLGGWPERSTKPAGMGQSWRHSIEITPLWITHSTKTPLSLWKDFFDPKKWSANSHLFSCGVPTHIFFPVVGRTKAITAGLPHQLGQRTRYSSSNLAMLTGATFGVAVQMLWIVVAGRVRGFNSNPLFFGGIDHPNRDRKAKNRNHRSTK